jgi:Spy/CpxP family protein refolding chaperone
VKPWKAILAVIVIFLAGAFSGAMAAHLYRAKVYGNATAAGGPPIPSLGQRIEFMRRLSDRLSLTPEQRQQVDRLISDSERRLRELWEPVAPKAREEMHELRRQIDAVLQPDQRAQFEKLRKQRPTGERPSVRRHEGRSDGRTNRVPSSPDAPREAKPPLAPGTLPEPRPPGAPESPAATAPPPTRP